MSDKKGWSEERTNFWGEKYTQHHDEHGHKTGWSEERTDFWGDKYTQHHDESGSKTGWSDTRTDFFGDNYEQHHDHSGSKTGWSEERTDFFGDNYAQHHDQSGSKAGWSEARTDVWGDAYEQHYGSSPKSSANHSASEINVPSPSSASRRISFGSSVSPPTPTGYSYYKTSTFSAPPAQASSSLGWLVGIGVTIVILVCVGLGPQWYATYQNWLSDQRAKEQARIAEAIRANAARLAEGTRAEQAFPGEWYYSNRSDGRLAKLRISREGDTFNAEYRSAGRVEALHGELEDDNRLRLQNNRQVGKIVDPHLYYVGDFSHEAWLQLSHDGNVVLVSFHSTGPTFAIKRTATRLTRRSSEGGLDPP